MNARRVLDAVSEIYNFAQRTRQPAVAALTRLQHEEGSGYLSDDSQSRALIASIMAANLTATRASTGATVFVTGEMMSVLKAAEQTMPERGLDADDLPWPAAVCVFEVPLCEVRFTNPIDRPVPVSAVTWALVSVNERRKLLSADLAEWPAAPGAIENVSWYHSAETGWWPALATTWWYGEPPTGSDDGPNEAGVHRLLACLWLLLAQRIAVHRTVRVDRPARRAWERKHPGALPPEITIIELRRPKPEDREPGEGEPVEWSHRWIVGGHWRNQFYPSTGDNRPIWVAPYVKGPEDKPLIRKDRLHAWVR